MANAAGDLTTVLSLDDFEYLTGMKEATVATDQLAAHAEHAGHSMHRALHRGAHLAGSFAFMLSEGKSAEDMKGKLEGLTMMAPMVGLAIGGWAAPLGIAAGIIGASLIPKILEGKEAFDQVAKSIEEAGKELAGFIRREQAMIDFRDKLKDMNESKDLTKTGQDLNKDLEKNKVATAATMKLLQDTEKSLVSLRESKKAAGASTYLDFLPGSLISEKLGGPTASQLLGKAVGAVEIDPAIKELEKRREEIGAKLRELGAEQKMIDDQKEALDKETKEKGAAGVLDTKFAIEQSKQLLEMDQKRRELAERIGKEIATPYEKAQEKIRELKEARLQGLISDKQFDAGSKQAMREFAESQKQHGTNDAALGGTAEAFKQIRESIRAAQEGRGPELKLLKDQVDESKRMRIGVERLYDAVKSDVGVGIV